MLRGGINMITINGIRKARRLRLQTSPGYRSKVSDSEGEAGEGIVVTFRTYWDGGRVYTVEPDENGVYAIPNKWGGRKILAID